VARVRALQEQLLSLHTGRTPEQLRQETERDLILTPEQAVAYGVVDRVLTVTREP
jgi:ATP-dependent Clp protease protease subunit